MTTDALREHITARIASIEADDRYQADSAAVQINAPLALVQTDMAARHNELRRLLAKLDGGGEAQGQSPESEPGPLITPAGTKIVSAVYYDVTTDPVFVNDEGEVDVIISDEASHPEWHVLEDGDGFEVYLDDHNDQWIRKNGEWHLRETALDISI